MRDTLLPFPSPRLLHFLTRARGSCSVAVADARRPGEDRIPSCPSAHPWLIGVQAIDITAASAMYSNLSGPILDGIEY
jgi:hypothetical protein